MSGSASSRQASFGAPSSVLISVVVHVGVGAILLGLRPGPGNRVAESVQFEVLRPVPPAPSVVPPVAPSVAKPVLVARPKTLPRPVLAHAPPALRHVPPPVLQPTPDDTPPPRGAPPVFGVSLDSVVGGDSPVALPVGNTLATGERKAAPVAGPVGAPNGESDPGLAFSPVGDMYIAEENRLQHEVRAEYPAEAKRLNVEGKVLLKVGVDRRGAIRLVRVIKSAGHGFDQAAEKALWQFRFSPARTQDGRPVDRQFTYTYTFQLPR